MAAARCTTPPSEPVRERGDPTASCTSRHVPFISFSSIQGKRWEPAGHAGR